MMEGGDVVEGVAIGEFPVDGANATEFLAGWIKGMRWRSAIQAVVLGGITLAGLGVVDIEELADRLDVPVFAVTRHKPGGSRLAEALQAAGLPERLPVVKRTPPAVRIGEGLYVAPGRASRDEARALIRPTIRKSRMPEPLRVAHIIARALVRGESRGRV
jgi:endonuclease V-like protein UPF0215 family